MTAARRPSRPEASAAVFREIARLIDNGWTADAIARLSPLVAAPGPNLAEACILLARIALTAGDGSKTASLLALARQHAQPRTLPRLRQVHGEFLRQQHRHAEAAAELKWVLGRCRADDAPTAARATLGLARIALADGDRAEALRLLTEATRLDGENREALVSLAELLAHLGDGTGALRLVRHALGGELGDAKLLGRIALLLRDLHQLDIAEAACKLALELEANNTTLLNTLGTILLGKNLNAAAAACFERILTLDPRHAQAHCNLGHSLHHLNRPGDAVEAFGRALAIDPDLRIARSNLLLNRHYDPRADLAILHDEARRLAQPLERVASLAWTNPAEPNRRLRIGYVSGDFCSHPVGFFIESVLAAHDPGAVEIFCYSNGLRHDATTERLKAAAHHWRPIAGDPDDVAASRIREDRTDILIDLSGHTAGNRLALFARKPAPVQATWLGYFGTTGLATIDYIIADRFVLPPADEPFYSEAPYRLPHSYLCFTPPAIPVDVGPLPAAGGHITFGCFNNIAKINRHVIELWAKLLCIVPGSKLFLKAKQLAEPATGQRLAGEFAERGVTAERLIFGPPGSRAQMLAAYNEVDIGLDPFPFNGGTTTAEALWMGVPVISLRGDRFVGRVGESILSTVGVGELVAADPDEYLAKAAALAADLPRLAALRAGLRDRMLASPLCRPDAFTRALEDAYRAMWRDWCRQQEQAA